VIVHVLHRIFDGDDVAVAVLVAIADHRGERGRFALPGAADHDDETALHHADVAKLPGQVELLERGYARVDGAHHQSDAALLDERTHAEAPDAARAYREVALLGGFEFGRLFVVHHRARDLGSMLRRERLVRHRGNPAVYLDRRREACRDEEIRGALRDHGAQQVLHELQCLVSFHVPLRAP
jgi:hypothetical protein